MTPDWSKVSIDHVRQACNLYDSGRAVPKRPAKSTFLLLDGKSYPAKFIRGLAYRLATGVELDPNTDYSGGLETIRFFEALGLTTQHDPTTATSPPPPSVASLAPAGTSTPVVKEHRDPQKRALADLLRCRFGSVETEAQFPWLMVPVLEEMDAPVRRILDALVAMRGFSGFATAGASLRCDFYVPGGRLVLEYDERQHFTSQRATALELYPPDIRLGFDRQGWIDACRSIRATDPTPPHRDEQRAFYDTLRDILAARNGVRLVRVRYGTNDWTAAGAAQRLDAVLAPTRPDPTSAVLPSVSSASCLADGRINKIALVTHDYNVADSNGRYDYSEHFGRINRLGDEQGCDTILYALYTWDEHAPAPRTQKVMFSGLSHVERIILEVGQPPDSYDHVEVWQQGEESPLVATQRFATSSAPGYQKQAFLDDLPQRQVQDALLVLCGETNIASLVRGSDEFYDPYQFADRLRDMGVRIVLNPVHDYMRRYEMRQKRRYYSLGGRTVISVWNQGKGQESHRPWTVFHHGEERTGDVHELDTPINERPDIRIGIIDLSRLAAGPSGMKSTE